MDFSASRRKLLALVTVVAATTWAGCTEGCAAYIKVDARSTTAIDTVLEVLRELNWRIRERRPERTILISEDVALKPYSVWVDPKEGGRIEISLGVLGTNRFSTAATTAYYTLIDKLRARFDDAVTFDTQTTSGQRLNR
jgi:hypothetical protein